MEDFKMNKDYELRSNWFALYLAIIKNEKPVDALRYMGVTAD
jgi:hypothetical protein